MTCRDPRFAPARRDFRESGRGNEALAISLVRSFQAVGIAETCAAVLAEMVVEAKGEAAVVGVAEGKRGLLTGVNLNLCVEVTDGPRSILLNDC